MNLNQFILATENHNRHQTVAETKDNSQSTRWTLPGWRLFSGALLFALALAAQGQGTQSNYWTGSGSGINWSTAGNWNPSSPGAGSDVFFTPTGGSGATFVAGGGTPNNEVDTSFSIYSLWSQPTNVWQVTEIPTGNTLTITGSITNSTLVSLGTDYYALWVGSQINQSMYQSFQGGGTLFVNNPAAMVVVRNSYNAYISSYPVLDLSGLSTFTANVIGVCVGGEGTTDASFNDRPIGILYLAQTNVITSTNTLMLRPSSLPGPILDVSDSIVDTGDTSYVYLGNSNAFLGAVGIAVGWRRGQGYMAFNSSAVNGYAYFRNLAGTGTQSYWGIGDNYTGNTGFTSTGTVDFTGGTVNAMVDQMYVGRSGTSTTSGADGTGTLLIGNGIITVNDLYIGTQRTGNNVGWGNGTVTTSGGATVTNLIVNSNLAIGTVISGGGVTSTAGALNINSCVIVSGNLVAGGAPNSTVTLNGGSLTVGGTMGQSTGALNTVNLNAGTLNLSLGSAGNPSTPVCNISNLNVSSLTLNVTGVGLTPGTIPVMKYYASGTFSGITYGTIPPQTYGYFSNSANTLYLVITNVDAPKWTGAVNGNWDTTTANWLGQLSGNPTTFEPLDSVLFDDSATGTTTINLTTNLNPSAVTVNNSAKIYAFGGSGEITGATGLNKEGSAMLILTNTGTNTFTGPITINGGDVQLGVSNALPANAMVTLANAAGANLDLNGQYQQLGGLAGGGASGGTVTLGAGTLTLAANGSEFDGIISGSGNVDISGGTEIFGGANTYTGSTLINGGTLVVVNSSGSGIGTGNLLIASGTLQLGNGGAGGSISQTTITNDGNFAFDLANDLNFSSFIMGTGGITQDGTNTVYLLSSNDYTGQTTIANGAISISSPTAIGLSNSLSISANQTSRIELNGNITVTQPITVASKSGSFGAPPHVENISGSNVLFGAISGFGGGTDWSFQVDSGELVVSGTFSNTSTSVSQDLNLRGGANGQWYPSVGNGSSPSYVVGLNKLDTGIWTLMPSSVNTYTGPTSVENGSLVVNGSILDSSGVNITYGTLSGGGLIACPVNNGFPGTLAPTGTLTISNTLTLTSASACIFNAGIDGSDQIAGLTSVAYAGELQVNQTGPLDANEVFHLFSGTTNFSGAFDYFQLPGLMAPLVWDTSYLTVDGTLRIEGGPSITSYGFSAPHTFQISGTGAAGYNYTILATTNLTVPLSNWTAVATGTFAGDNSFSFTDTNAATYPNRFYQVITP